MTSGGSELRCLREQLGLTMRDVENASEQIARRRGNEEFFVPISRLSDFETKGVIPSIYRMSSLASIYQLPARDIFSWYGVDFDSGPKSQDLCPAIPLLSKDREMTATKNGTSRNTAPPIAGCYLLDLVLPRKHRENLVGDIEEDYRANILPRYGRTAASIWFWKQVVIEIVPGLYLRIVTSFVKHLFETSLK
jgi:transcriptional regulator with XRE-family HTH domain